MDIGHVLSRSIEIGWRYRVLWVLALIFVLFGGGAATVSPGNNFNYSFDRSSFPSGSILPSDMERVAGIIALLVLCVLLLWFLASLYFRFVARGAMVAAVRSIENGATPTFGTAWRDGQKYWARLLGLGFLVNLPLVLLWLALIICIIALFGATIIQYFNVSVSGGFQSPPDPTTLISTLFGAFGLFCCALLCMIAINIVIHPIYQFAVRAIVLEEQGTVAGLKRGYSQVVSNLGSVVLIYLALVGIRIMYFIVAAIIGLLFGVIMVAVATGLSQQSTVAMVAGLFALLIPFGLLFWLLESMFQVLEQTVWTEAYVSLLNPPGTGPRVPTAPAPTPVAPPPSPAAPTP